MITFGCENKNFCFPLILVLVCFSLSACEKRAPYKENVIGYVNAEPIFASELDQALTYESRKFPTLEVSSKIKKKQLDLLIDRKLIVQEAIDSGLTRDQSFIASIKTYWEQALVRRFIDQKRREFEGKIVVTEKDFKDYYEQISKRVTFKVFANADKKIVEEKRDELLAGDNFFGEPWQTIGPVSYQDISSKALRSAFDAKQGDSQVIEDAGVYYLVYVFQSDAIPQGGAYVDLVPELKKRVIAVKESEMFDEWLKNKRKKSQIKMLQ